MLFPRDSKGESQSLEYWYSPSTADCGKIRKNDVDALRHAYVSGVFTMEYSSLVARILGDMNEFRLNFGQLSET